MTVRTSSNPTYSNLAVAAAAAANTGLVIDSTVDVTSSPLAIEVPVEVEPGGQIRVANGMTVTFIGPFTAPPIRIFVRDAGWGGNVVFGNGNAADPNNLYNPVFSLAKIREAVWVTPSWWENGTTNDTDAVTIALRYNRVRFTRRYRVTSVKSEAIYQMIDMAGFFLHGIAPTPEPDPNEPNKPTIDAVLTLRNWREGRMFNAGITSDGDQKAPAHALNYKCALLCESENATPPHGNKTQFGYIYGLRIQNMKTGIAWGQYEGDPTAPGPAQESQTQSEFHIYDYSPRGVLAPFVGNASNAFLQFHNSIFAVKQYEASTKGSGTGWWFDAEGRTLVNLVGSLRLTGGSIQRAVEDGVGYNLYGHRIVVENCDIERNCPDYLTGDVTYRSCRNGYYGQAASTPFRIAPLAIGRLLLDDVVIRRPAGTADADGSSLVDASQAPDYEIVFRDTVAGEWHAGPLALSSGQYHGYLALGGRTVFDGLTIDNPGQSTSYRLREGPNRLTDVDPTGRTMSTSSDLTEKGGWVSIGAAQGGFSREALSQADADLLGTSSAIRLGATADGVEVETGTAFPIDSGRDRIVELLLKCANESGSLRICLRWLNAGGVEISRPVLLDRTLGELADKGFGNWLRLRVFGSAPIGAVKAKLSFYLGAGADLMVTDIRVV